MSVLPRVTKRQGMLVNGSVGWDRRLSPGSSHQADSVASIIPVEKHNPSGSRHRPRNLSFSYACPCKLARLLSPCHFG